MSKELLRDNISAISINHDIIADRLKDAANIYTNRIRSTSLVDNFADKIAAMSLEVYPRDKGIIGEAMSIVADVIIAVKLNTHKLTKDAYKPGDDFIEQMNESLGLILHDGLKHMLKTMMDSISGFRLEPNEKDLIPIANEGNENRPVEEIDGFDDVIKMYLGNIVQMNTSLLSFPNDPESIFTKESLRKLRSACANAEAESCKGMKETTAQRKAQITH